jgi:hypothetical protein
LLCNYFKKKRLRQRDPLSPTLFYIAIDISQVLVKRARGSGLVKSCGAELVEGRLTMLQYEDDTVLFLEASEEYARSSKICICHFEHLLGLKFNFH